MAVFHFQINRFYFAGSETERKFDVLKFTSSGQDVIDAYKKIENYIPKGHKVFAWYEVSGYPYE